MGVDRAYLAFTQAASPSVSWAQTPKQSGDVKRHLVRVAQRDSLGTTAQRIGFWQRDDVLASSPRLAAGWLVGQGTPRVAEQTPGGRQDRLVAGRGGQRLGAGGFWGAKTGPSPTDRRKNGSKHHLATDAHGLPLAATLTAANAHDVTQLLPVIDAIPPVAGKVGRPRQRPDRVQGDRAYDSQPHREALRQRGIKPVLARRYVEHGSGLGATRWVVERTHSWLHQNRRLRVRYERRADIHEAFLILGCIKICHACLKQSFC
jgi:transposase